MSVCRQDGPWWDRAGNRNIVRGPSMQLSPCAEEDISPRMWSEMQSCLEETELDACVHDWDFNVFNLLFRSGFLTVADVINVSDTDMIWSHRLNALRHYMSRTGFAATASVAADANQIWRVNLYMDQQESDLRRFMLLLAPVFDVLVNWVPILTSSTCTTCAALTPKCTSGCTA